MYDVTVISMTNLGLPTFFSDGGRDASRLLNISKSIINKVYRSVR